ncbi:MAG: YiiD C-terminal domain-containing protein [Longimicrobiales bacterium]
MSLDLSDLEALRARINGYAPYLGAGIVVTEVADDEIHVEMALTNQNRNLVGTHFGGSLYAMVDPHLMILVMRRLGARYVVWDKSASIEFLKPGVGTVRAHIQITDAEIESIRSACEGGNRHFPEWTVEITDGEGEVVATVAKTLYVRREPPN